MRKQSGPGFQVPRTDETLLFLLGLFSTWQIVQLLGLAVSTWLTLFACGYLILTRKPAFRKNWNMICLFIGYLAAVILSVCNGIPATYKKTSILSFIQWALVFVLASYLHGEDSPALGNAFLKGLDWSCRIQLVWCFFQLVTYKLLGKDLNRVIFGDLLHMVEQTSQYRDGVLACTGLHWHAANLIPVLTFLYFRHRSLVVKLLCIVGVYFSKSATAMIGIFLCVLWECVVVAKQILVNNKGGVSKKAASAATLLVAAAMLLMPVILPKIWEMASYLLQRLDQIKNPSLGQESSAVHFSYYQNLPHILSHISLPEVLFGAGIDTSGYRFTQFYNQYPDIIWVVESDFVNLILSIGLFGCAVHYTFVATAIGYLLRSSQCKKYAWWILILIPCGIVYNNQFLWVLLAELVLFTTAPLFPADSAHSDPV